MFNPENALGAPPPDPRPLAAGEVVDGLVFGRVGINATAQARVIYWTVLELERDLLLLTYILAFDMSRYGRANHPPTS